MQDAEIISELQSIFEQEKVECSVLPSSEDIPYSRLIVFMGNDYQQRERILTVTASPQMLAEQSQKEIRYIRVQFQAVLPFKVKQEASYEIAGVLHFLNHLLELPGFEYNEADDQVSYRYVLLATKPNENASLYPAVLGLIMMTLDLFTETIEKIANGQATFNQLLEQMLSLSKQLKT